MKIIKSKKKWIEKFKIKLVTIMLIFDTRYINSYLGLNIIHNWEKMITKSF